MFKRLVGDHSDTLGIGRKFAEEHRCNVYQVSVYHGEGKSTDFLVSAALYHLLPNGNYSASCHPAFGWHFGGPTIGYMDTTPEGQALLALPDEPALPGDQEFWGALVAGYVSRATPEQRLAITQKCEAEQVCVMHASWEVFGGKGHCGCAPCEKGSKSA